MLTHSYSVPLASLILPCAVAPPTPSYHCQKLQDSDLNQMLALQEVILDNLPPADRHYIVPKTPAHFAKFLTPPYAAIGVFDGDRLIAQTLVAYVQPQDDDKNLTACDASLPLVQTPQPYAVMEGVLVDPHYRKLGLMTDMVSHGVDLVEQAHGCTTIYAEVADGNQASLRGFRNNGFAPVARGVDPSDGCALVFVQHQPSGT